MPALIVFVLGFAVGALMARRRGAKWLDCLHRGAVFGIVFALLAFVAMTIGDIAGVTRGA